MRATRAEYSIATPLVSQPRPAERPWRTRIGARDGRSAVDRARRARLALRRRAVAADVAVLAADREHDGVLGAEVAKAPDGQRVDAHEAPRLQRDHGAVAELHLDVAGVHEVELLLLLVQVC